MTLRASPALLKPHTQLSHHPRHVQKADNLEWSTVAPGTGATRARVSYIGTEEMRLRHGMVEDFHKEVAERVMSIALSREEIWKLQMKRFNDD